MYSSIFKCWGSSLNTYEPIKKDDDFTSTTFQTWIKIHPINKEMKNWDDRRIQNFVKNIIKTLPIAHTTDANFVSVKSHLYELANTSSRFRRFLLDEIKKVSNMEIKLKAALLTTVIDCDPISL